MCMDAGPIPPEWSAWGTALQKLSLSNFGYLTPGLPPSFSAFVGLSHLDFRSNNGASGGIPAAWQGQFANLSTFAYGEPRMCVRTAHALLLEAASVCVCVGGVSDSGW